MEHEYVDMKLDVTDKSNVHRGISASTVNLMHHGPDSPFCNDTISSSREIKKESEREGYLYVSSLTTTA